MRFGRFLVSTTFDLTLKIHFTSETLYLDGKQHNTGTVHADFTYFRLLLGLILLCNGTSDAPGVNVLTGVNRYAADQPPACRRFFSADDIPQQR